MGDGEYRTGRTAAPDVFFCACEHPAATATRAVAHDADRHHHGGIAWAGAGHTGIFFGETILSPPQPGYYVFTQDHCISINPGAAGGAGTLCSLRPPDTALLYERPLPPGR